ncbi:MBL fold metallo-hydrolase [Marinisporobacter balticus]|uniref:Glyoxylase-like metal-dependent hydrolase (Beta-lactamase superfamily II) n=1 Tax=Marinisporobacter balticus TaxID=2018667 RepID=A0A4R2KG02_9FIRM|nr:MBL fold metallo-hydrolase [Marinisporobacter balticus]TCO69356.1 glyoxylase-like metal-dependent hydrolase (beta-lactamase superfamily II) [Marinisporobacter balticus]
MDIELKILKTGYCIQLEKISIKEGRFKTIKFPAMVVLIKHPKQGYILFDTGYSHHFFKETKKFPYSIYKKITPVYLEESETVVSQLKKLNLSAKDIQYIILSHFHSDHISGCKDFPNAKFICSKVGYESIQNKKGISALKEGFIPNLLPMDFSDRIIFFEERQITKFPIIETPFDHVIDLFGDKRIYAVLLSGHTKGHYGIFLKSNNQYYFFIGDACWSSKTFEEYLLPHFIANFIMKDKKSYMENVKKLYTLHKAHPHIHIIPSHCLYTVEEAIKNVSLEGKSD